MSNVRIDIAAVWKGAQAFNKATKATKKLDTQVSILSKRLVSVYAANKVLQFSKKMVNAFTEDQASAAILSNTVKNLGLSFADVDIKSFIDKLSLAAGVADDELRPAMQRLLTTTGSITKSEKLLQNAIDIAKGSGQDLQTVVLDLSNAYVGNNKGLKKYTLGLSAAELKTASFDKVLAAFNKNFAGSNAAYLNTYAGQIEKITVASKEAQETIGQGYVDAFKILYGGNAFGSLSEKITKLSVSIADFFRGLAQGFKDLSNMPIIHQLIQLAGLMLKIAGKVAGAVIDPFVKSGARSRSAALAPASANSFLTEHMASANAAKQTAAEKAAAKRAKELAAAQTKQTKAIKDQAALKKAQGVFDIQQIELVAALKGKLSDEEKLRAEAQLALLAGNDALAKKLTDQILLAQDATGNLSKFLTSLPNANNPFQYLDAYLDNLKTKADALTGGNSTDRNTMIPSTNAPNGNNPVPSIDYGGHVIGSEIPNFTPNVIVQIDGKTIASTLMDQSLSGNQSYVDRRTGGFNW